MQPSCKMPCLNFCSYLNPETFYGPMCIHITMDHDAMPYKNNINGKKSKLKIAFFFRYIISYRLSFICKILIFEALVGLSMAEIKHAVSLDRTPEKLRMKF